MARLLVVGLVTIVGVRRDATRGRTHSTDSEAARLGSPSNAHRRVALYRRVGIQNRRSCSVQNFQMSLVQKNCRPFRIPRTSRMDPAARDHRRLRLGEAQLVISVDAHPVSTFDIHTLSHQHGSGCKQVSLHRTEPSSNDIEYMPKQPDESNA